MQEHRSTDASGSEIDPIVASALANRLVSREQVDRCLEIRETLAAVGIALELREILCAKGFLNSAEAEVLSSLQQKAVLGETLETTARADLPEKDLGKIGAIIIANRLLSQQQVQECLRAQEQAARMGLRLKLGEVMRHKDYLQPEVLETVLSIQRAQRRRHRPVVVPVASAFGVGVAFGALLLVMTMSREEDPSSLSDWIQGDEGELSSRVTPIGSGQDPLVTVEVPPGSPVSPAVRPQPDAPRAESVFGPGGRSDPDDAHPRCEIERKLFPDPPERPGERELFPDRFLAR